MAEKDSIEVFRKNLEAFNKGDFKAFGDTLAEKNIESYVAAQAFPGTYKINVERIWGQPGDDKAQLQVICNQGTDREISRLYTLNLKDEQTLTFNLEEGRRTEAAANPARSPITPPPSATTRSFRSIRAAMMDSQTFSKVE